MQALKSLLEVITKLQNLGGYLMHIAIFIIFIWIGGLKFVPYEAEGIAPFVANSPFFSFMYKFEKPAYKQHKMSESQSMQEEMQDNPKVVENKEWHKENRTYLVAEGLGITIMILGILVLLGLWMPLMGVIGGLLVAGMTITTLSFLFTTPEVFVNQHFPWLSGAGRLVVKDLALFAGGLFVAGFDAKRYLEGKGFCLMDRSSVGIKTKCSSGCCS
ncbi:YkgB family protein [Helicobacter pylori]|uniref:Inner membrane protein ykgB n=1 Tax=Helicobacter pylori Hp P-15 TaxID=992080 RepID=I9WNR1_HELPX|nr:YkgB family protein [Helicobacter pylori]EJC07567.1 inner membrane protein ykgB [Helicobacter pylori Hp P-15]EJC32334.1 inner membrane protein ykgB [Helicobacter pylori Hp P-15b]